jgi:sugar phosphate isomerase/epimerase
MIIQGGVYVYVDVVAVVDDYNTPMYKNLSLGALGHSVPFDQACRIAAQTGFAGIDLDTSYLLDLARSQSVQAARDWFAATGLIASSIGLSVAWRDWDDERKYVDSLPRFIEEARLAAEFGVARCATWVMPCSNTLTFHEHFALAVRRLRPVADILKAYGIRLGLEFVGPRTLRASRKHPFVHTMDGMRALAAAIGTGNVGFLLDCFHWHTAHGVVGDIEALPREEVVYVHVNDARPGRSADEQIDSERDMVGATGVVDIAGFLGALRTIGYDGPVTVEPFLPALKALTPEQAAATASQALDKVLSA